MDWMEQEKKEVLQLLLQLLLHSGKINKSILSIPQARWLYYWSERSLRVLDGGIAVFDASQWVEPQSETVWKQADKYGVARIAFVNKMDKTGGDFFMTVESIKKKLAGNKVVPIQLPLGLENDFYGIVDLVQMKAFTFEGDHGEKIIEIEIPADMKDKAESMRLELMEKVAEQDDALMEKYFAEGELSIEEIKKRVKKMSSC